MGSTERTLRRLDSVTDRSSRGRTVLMVTPYFPPEGGGLEQYATTIASSLVADHGWRVVFATSGARGSSAAVAVEQGFKVYRLPAQVTLSRTPLALSWPRRVAAIAGTNRLRSSTRMHPSRVSPTRPR